MDQIQHFVAILHQRINDLEMQLAASRAIIDQLSQGQPPPPTLTPKTPKLHVVNPPEGPTAS